MVTIKYLEIYLKLTQCVPPTEYGERPLKLVLKVAGNEVTTGSSSFENTFDEHPDLEKHKDKKKKKKDKEKIDTMSPVDDKKNVSLGIHIFITAHVYLCVQFLSGMSSCHFIPWHAMGGAS